MSPPANDSDRKPRPRGHWGPQTATAGATRAIEPGICDSGLIDPGLIDAGKVSPESSGGAAGPATLRITRKSGSASAQAKRLLGLARIIDEQWSDPSLRSQGLRDLQELFFRSAARTSEGPWKHIQHLLSNTSQWTPLQLHSFMVPLERFLNQKISDGDFLVRSTDRLPVPSSASAAIKTPSLPLRLILDEMRSALNVGNMLRTADCLSLSAVDLCGYTPLPTDLRVQKSALGAELNITWRSWPTSLEAIEHARSLGYTIVACETAEGALDLHRTKIPSPAAIVFGNERFGLGAQVLRHVDTIIHLPTLGHKNSLNVSACWAAVGYEVYRQWTT